MFCLQCNSCFYSQHAYISQENRCPKHVISFSNNSQKSQFLKDPLAFVKTDILITLLTFKEGLTKKSVL